MRKKNYTAYKALLTRLCVCALITSVAVILDGFLKIPVDLFGVYALKLSFGMVPVIFLSIRYGPLYGGVCGAIMDILQLVLFPTGVYNPLFTIGCFLNGLIPGLFFLKGKHIKKLRLFISVFTGQTVGAAILNTLFLIISYQMPLKLFIPRSLTQVILIPLYTVFLYLILSSEAKYAEASDVWYK